MDLSRPLALAPTPPPRSSPSRSEVEMYVIKRDGREEKVQLDKITARISKLTDGLDMRFIDPVSQ